MQRHFKQLIRIRHTQTICQISSPASWAQNEWNCPLRMAGSDCQDALERWVHVCSASSRSQVEVTRCHICSLFTLIMRRCHFDYSARTWATWHWIWWVSVTLWGVSLNRQRVKQICVPRYGIMPEAFDSVILGHYSQWSFLYLCHLLHSNHSLTLTS